MSLKRLYFEFVKKHKFFINDEEEIDLLLNSYWYSSLSQIEKQEINEWIIYSSTISSQTSRLIIENTPSENTLTLPEAIKYLEQPFKIIVENVLNDSYFLDCLIQNFRKQTKNIVHFKSERWLMYENGGGTTIPHVIDATKKSFNGKLFSKPSSFYLRYFVIIDSDKKYPDMELPQSKKELIKYLEDNDVPYKILEKREMENYLPVSILEKEISDNQDFIRAFSRLNPIQKDYFDIENGFPNKNFKDLDGNLKDFFSGISDEDYGVLRSFNLKSLNGGKDNFKSEFPKLFESDKIDREMLLNQCSHHSDTKSKSPYDRLELPNLLIQIDKLL